MSRNTNLSLYLAKVETTEGTDAAPTPAANAIALAEPFDPTYDFAFRNPRDRTVRGVVLDADKPLPPAGRVVNWTKRAWFRGNGAAATAVAPIELDPWLQSAGLAATYDAQGVTYTPANSALKSITEWVYHDGKLRKATGVRADLGLSFDVGGPCIIEHVGQGSLASISDAAITAPTLKTSTPPVATDMATFTVDGFVAGVIRRFAMRTGADIQRRTGVKAVGGVQGHRLNGRKATWEIVLEEPLISAKDFDALAAAGQSIAIAWLLGAIAHNKLDFSAAEAIVETVTPSSDNGLALVTLTGGLYGATPYSLAVKA